jgi:UDP-2,3-diacylglucosamine pyrophosphatase LpxH
MKTIIVSDLHIGSPYFLYRLFENFLERLPDRYELVLNGDIIDNPYARPTAQDLSMLDRITRESLCRRVILVRGNHDDHLEMKDPRKIEITRAHTIAKRLLIVHGDDFDDIMPRNMALIRIFKFMHDLRVLLGASPVHVAFYAKQWKFFYRILCTHVMLNAVRCARENGFEAVTCGHTHFAEDIIMDGVRYINTGAWTESPTYCLIVDEDAIVMKAVDEKSILENAFFLRGPVRLRGDI